MSYDPTIAQPFTSGCVFWLGMDESNNYVNLITNIILTNNNVSNNDPTYTFDDNISVPVFNNTNRVGAYIRSGFSFNGTTDYSITFYVKNPTIDSAYNDELVLSNTKKSDGKGEISIQYHKIYGFGVGSVSSTIKYFTASDGIDITDWLKVAITSNASTGLKTVVVNGVEKSYTASAYGTAYEIGICDTTVNTGSYLMSLNGAFADVRFYDRVLTSSEIADFNSTISTINCSISLETGAYLSSDSIEITADVSGAMIYYTTDGTDPDTSSTVYSGAISMFTGTLKAFAVADGYDDSDIVSATYTLVYQVIESCHTDILLVGQAVSDFSMDIQAFQSFVEDAGLDVSIGYQTVEICSVDIDTLGEISRNNMLDLFLAYQLIETMPVSVSTAKETIKDTVVDISLGNGIITRDMSVDINLGDGYFFQNFGMSIMTVSKMPVYKYVYSMNINSVISEVI